MLCKHLWNTASPTPLNVQEDSSIASSKPSTQLRLIVSRFSSHPQSWHWNEENIVTVQYGEFNGLFPASQKQAEEQKQIATHSKIALHL